MWRITFVVCRLYTSSYGGDSFATPLAVRVTKIGLAMQGLIEEF